MLKSSMGGTYILAATSVFVVVSPTAYIPTHFHIRGYAGHTGRMDVLIRSMASCAGGNFSFYGLLCGKEEIPGSCPAIIVEDCSSLPLGVDEHELVKSLLGDKLDWARIETIDVEHLVWRLYKRFPLIIFDENGLNLCGRHIVSILEGRSGFTFFLGGHTGFPEEVYRIILRYKPLRISVGPISLHTSNVIILARYIFEVGLGSFCENLKSFVKGEYHSHG